jgi:hypothetical protein
VSRIRARYWRPFYARSSKAFPVRTPKEPGASAD